MAFAIELVSTLLYYHTIPQCYSNNHPRTSSHEVFTVAEEDAEKEAYMDIVDGLIGVT